MRAGRCLAPVAVVCVIHAACPTQAFGHASERGQIMLLPTELYILGGGLAVLASVLLMIFFPSFARWKTPLREFVIARIPLVPATLTSLTSLAVISILVLAGLFGPPDPISNPLPGSVWSLWWFGFTLLCLLLGNLWPLFNPWTGLVRMIGPSRPLLLYPPWLGHWPAVILFLSFAWFELAYPAPDDPPRLASAMTGYFAANLLGIYLFGEEEWMRKAEAFSVYFRMVGRLSPFQWSTTGGVLSLGAGLPGHGLLLTIPPVAGKTAFVLLTLAAISFDGLSQTFFWIDQLGLNPLEFPGRSSVVFANTTGLILMALGLAAVYAIVLQAGSLITRTWHTPGLVTAIIPIALAYHLAHYLPDFPIEAKRAIKALSDPFGTGLDLFGTAHLSPPASMMMDHHTAAFIYRLQTATIVAGHIVAVTVAHLRALQSGAPAWSTVLGQAPLNALMVFYTVFGLWLLSAPLIS